MLEIKRIKFVLLLCLIVAFGCKSLPRTYPKLLSCPEPTQNCMPQKYTGMGFDTTEETRRYKDYYYEYLPVKQINSPADEWSVSFLGKSTAALCFTDHDKQNVMFIKFSGFDRASITSGIGMPVEGSVGSMAINGNHVVFSLSTNDIVLGKSGLYEATLEGNIFSNVKPVEDSTKIDKLVWTSHPSMSSDGKVLFFASDRQSQFAGTDIWFMVKLPSGEWSDPINCGGNINTRCDELTPFVSPAGNKLFFASSGWESVGGYDIFVSDINPKFWATVSSGNIQALKTGMDFFLPPKNLKTPLNTPFDELFPSCPDGDCDSLLYYSSNQAASSNLVSMSGGYDIYVRRKIVKARDEIAKRSTDVNFDINPNLNPDMNIAPNFIIEGTVINQQTLVPVQNALVQATEPPSQLIIKETRTDLNGQYKLELPKDHEYEISAQGGDLFFDAFKVRVEKDDPARIIKQDFVLPEILTLRINFPTAIYLDPYKYTLDSNGVETSKYWVDELDLLAANIRGSFDKLDKIMLTGHTDDVGTVESNDLLGRRRAEFIKSELINRQIPDSLIVVRSAGKLEPLPERPGEDLKLYRKRLRRVEIEKKFK